MSKFWSGVFTALAIIINLISSVAVITPAEGVPEVVARFGIWSISFIFTVWAIVSWEVDDD